MDTTEETETEAKNNANEERSDENGEQQVEEKDDSPGSIGENPTDDIKPDDSEEIYDTIESPKGEDEAEVLEDVPVNDSTTSPKDTRSGTEGTDLEGENHDANNDKVVTVELSVEKTDRNPPEIVVEPKFPERLSGVKNALQPAAIRVVTPKYYSPLPPKKQSFHPLKPLEKTSSCEKFRHCLLLAIFSAFVFGYAIGGAYLFSHLERERDIEYNAKIDKWKNDTAILLATELRQVTPYEGIWARKVFQHLEVFEKDLLKASAIGYRRYDVRDREQRWTWTSSLYFSVALMTTSGYGPMTPRSEMGRTAAVLYSLFGIPLAISWLMVFGYLLATSWASLFHSICCSLCHEKMRENVENCHPAANHTSFVKQQKFRQNSVVPVEEQRLISRTNSQLRHPKNVCRTKYPPKSHNNYGVRGHNHVKPPNSVVPNKTADIVCRFAEFEKWRTSENEQIREMYHTMDYATAIVYAMVLFIIYFMFFSILFSLMEGWILTDVLYFSYLMFVTLGPGCHEMQDDGSETKIKNNIFYTVHLCIGYCILSMIVNLIYLLIQNRRVRVKFHKNEPYFDTFYQEKF